MKTFHKFTVVTITRMPKMQDSIIKVVGSNGQVLFVGPRKDWKKG